MEPEPVGVLWRFAPARICAATLVPRRTPVVAPPHTAEVAATSSRLDVWRLAGCGSAGWWSFHLGQGARSFAPTAGSRSRPCPDLAGPLPSSDTPARAGHTLSTGCAALT